MSFLNPTPVPATLYSSEDTDAPQLSNTDWTGAIKTILKACLVTGYGTKPGQGWVMSDETANKATFTPSDPAINAIGVIVDSSHKDYSTVDLHWQNVAQQFTQSPQYGRVHRLLYTPGQYQWRVVATACGFALTVAFSNGTYSSSGLLYFGQGCTNLTNPAGQDFVYYNSWDQAGAYAISRLYAMFSISPTNLVCGSGALSLTPTARNAPNAIMAAAAFHYSVLQAQRGKLTAPVQQSALYSEIFVRRDIGIIARIPGLLLKSHRLHTDNNLSLVGVVGSPHQWLHTDHEANMQSYVIDGVGLLINTEQWVY